MLRLLTISIGTVLSASKKEVSQMVYSYYPGCTLKNKAQDLDQYAALSIPRLPTR